MRLLVDTHALLWALASPGELLPAAREALTDGANDVLVSAASIWEIAIKRASGKLETPDDLLGAIETASFDHLPITAAHAERAGALPPHHNDPFDRMMVAQATIESLTVVTRDARFAPYGVPTLAA